MSDVRILWMLSMPGLTARLLDEEFRRLFAVKGRAPIGREQDDGLELAVHQQLGSSADAIERLEEACRVRLGLPEDWARPVGSQPWERRSVVLRQRGLAE